MERDELRYLAANFVKDKKSKLNFPSFPGLQKIKGIVDTPEFPGLDMEGRIDLIRRIIINQKRAKGFSLNIVNGTGNSFDINLSGTAKWMLGFVLTFTNQTVLGVPTSMTLTVNNDVVIQDAYPPSFSAGLTDREFYFYPRPLSGQDEIVLTMTGQLVNTAFANFYYI